ncbi:MAG: hypothetical protein HFJ35_01265 [Clostridia bacterium]|nr:hypothetical protein [Clostridia bacterium]
MGKFDSLLKTHNSKRKYLYDYTKLYKKGRFATSVDYDYFENLYMLKLLEDNKKKKYNEDLISLWGKLDMKSYIDYDLGNTINLYFVDSFEQISVSQLDDYNFMHEDSRKMNLLDIKYIKHLTLENIQLENLYLATFEILDKDNNFRPYVLIFTKDERNNFIEIGYGYDSNDNGNIELKIQSFNYPIFLTTNGCILLPLTNRKIKLNVYDYITDMDIQKIEKSNMG